jgi:hypothetical protein
MPVLRQVDGNLWDLERPLEGSCKLELLDFENEEGIATLIARCLRVHSD